MMREDVIARVREFLEPIKEQRGIYDIDVWGDPETGMLYIQIPAHWLTNKSSITSGKPSQELREQA